MRTQTRRPRAWMTLFSLALTIAWSGAQAESSEKSHELALSAKTVVIENLVGSFRLVPAEGDELRVEARVVGESAELVESISLRVAESDRRAEVLAEYPVGKYREYRYLVDSKGSSRTTTRYQGRKVKVSRGGRGDGVALHVDFVLRVPADVRLTVKNRVGTIDASSIQADLTLDTASGFIGVSDSKGPLSADTGSGSVKVKGHDGAVSVDTGSGSVSVEDVIGNVSVDTGSGTVTMSGVTGDVSADTGSGGIELEGIEADKIVADTGSGAVRGNNLRGSVRVDTGSGGVALKDLRAGDVVNVDTGSGRIVLQGDLSAVRELDLDTGSGGVKIEATALPDLRLSVRVGSGSIDVDVPGFKDVRMGSDYFDATLGDGDGRGVIESGSGSVLIKMM